MNNALYRKKIVPLLVRLCFPAVLVMVLSTSPMPAHAQNAAPDITPEKVARAIAALKQYGMTHKDAFSPPGTAVAIVYRDKPVAILVDGVLKMGQPEKINGDTTFQLASVSKPLGATVMAKLLGMGLKWKDRGEQGVVSWDTPIQKLMPGFMVDQAVVTDNVSSRITLGNLYSHRSGLPDHAGDDLEDLGYGRLEVFKRLRYIPGVGKNFNAREYAYTNFGLTAAGFAAASAAGMSWEVASDSLLYKPAGMRNTTSTYANFVENPNHAYGHVLRNGKWVFEEQRQPDAQSPAGGASSSANDMAQWMRLYLADGKLNGKQIVPAEALRELYSANIDVSDKEKQAAKTDTSCDNIARYVYGWNACRNGASVRISHSGAFMMGASTVVVMLPNEKLGIVVLTNGEPYGVAETLARGFLEAVQDDHLDAQKRFTELFAEMKQVMDKELRGPHKGVINPSGCTIHDYSGIKTDRYTGTYANDYFGSFKVASEKGQLWMLQGPMENHRYSLNPCASNAQNGFEFYYRTKGENAVGNAIVQFSADTPDAAADKMDVPYLTVGEFKRADR
ncbi:serine hydrolase domain-containing protein [Undibacterium sp.]|uniref:serine hydrolase domain-containing protein n=1 Tax=Undibacterium sp. TaxID=1914977 RepID=UPI00374CF40E